MTSGMTGGVGGGLPQAGASPYSITGGGSFILHYQGPDGKRKQLSHHKTRDEAVAAMRTHMRRMKKSVGGVHWTGEHQGTHPAFSKWADYGSGKRGDYGIMSMANGCSVYHMPHSAGNPLNWVGHTGSMAEARQLANRHHTNPSTTETRETDRRMNKSDGEIELEKAIRVLRKADAAAAKLAVGDRLPEDHSRYFLPHPQQKVIPISSLTPTHVQEKGLRNAEGFMRQAYNGEIARRKPITVSKRPGGGWNVEDGNSTMLTAKRHGWKTIPAVEGTYERQPGH